MSAEILIENLPFSNYKNYWLWLFSHLFADEKMMAIFCMVEEESGLLI
jgi:hypothetical protein